MSSPFLAPCCGRTRVRGFLDQIALVLAGILSFAITATAAEAPLTLSDAQHRAIERSRQLMADDAAAMASRDMAVAAGQLPDPVLKLGIDNLPIDGADRFSVTSDFMTMRRVGIMQELTRSEKRQLRAQRFEREAEKSLAQKTATLTEIQRDTALAWLDRYYAEAQIDVIAEQIKEANAEIIAAEGAYRAGRGSQADIFAARSARIALDDRTSEFSRRVRTAKIGLARWVGDIGDRPLAGKPAIDSIQLDTGAALGIHLGHHPAIALLSKQEEVALTEVRLAEANKKSDWNVELMYSQRGPAFSNMVSVGVSIPLPWDQKNRQDREVAAKRAMVEAVRAERDEMLRAHVAEVRKMIDEWENGRERLVRYERELLSLAKERTTAAVASYRGGKTNLNDVLLARRNEIDMRLQALQLEAETARLWAQLNFIFPEYHDANDVNHSTLSTDFPIKKNK
ncbi:MAG: TolC family protein [Pseudomonadota bacterium]